jgi:uncharacterized RDD family membrane protein YckC
MSISQRPPSYRAGYWRRVIATSLDVFFLSAVIGTAGLGMEKATHGLVRVRSLPVTITRCDMADLGPAQLEALHRLLPEDFRISSAEFCTSSAFGIPYNSVLSVGEKTQRGNSTYQRNVFLPLDSGGQPTNAFYLDYWLVFLLPAYLVLCEWLFGATIGKSILGIRVRTLSGAPMDFGQAGKRVVMRMIPFLPLMPLVIYATVVGQAKFAVLLVEQPTIVYAIALIGGGLLMLAFAGNFIIATSRHKLPWHDRWAQTEAQLTRTMPVMVHVLGTNHRITSAFCRFQLLQMEAISERVKPVTLRVAVYEGNEQISDFETVKFDSASDNADERKKWVNLVLKDRPYHKETAYRLVLRDVETGVEQQTVKVIIDRATTAASSV